MLTSKQLLTINADSSKENGQLYFFMLMNNCPLLTHVYIPDFNGNVLEIITSVIIIYQVIITPVRGVSCFCEQKKQEIS